MLEVLTLTGVFIMGSFFGYTLSRLKHINDERDLIKEHMKDLEEIYAELRKEKK